MTSINRPSLTFRNTVASDFDGYEWGLGSVFGLRAFNIDRHGRLTGVSHQTVWRPGENVAVCRKEAASLWSIVPTYSSTFTFHLDPSDSDVDLGENNPQYEAPKPPPPCQVPSATCGCGFWAYTDPADGLRHGGSIHGVVEGYGRTLIGTRGFRVQKARVAALFLSPRKWYRLTAEDRDTERLLRRNYPETPVYRNVRRMLTAHPLTASSKPDPSSDEFWTMP